MPSARTRRTISSLRTGLVGLVLIALLPAIGLFLLGDAGPGRSGDTQWKLGILLGLIGLSLVAAWAWSRAAILAPMDAMLDAAHRMREGDLTARIGLETLGGELGALARAFDEMAAALESREAAATQASGALRETNERLHAILTASPLAIVTYDRQGLMMHWNPAAER